MDERRIIKKQSNIGVDREKERERERVRVRKKEKQTQKKKQTIKSHTMKNKNGKTKMWKRQTKVVVFEMEKIITNRNQMRK